jgi:hypothetical protein
MSTLNDVAKAYKQAALQAINPGVPYKSYKTGSSRAYKTGNLFNQVNSSNNINSMSKLGKDKKSFTISFDIAPNGAIYGQYVHNGTSKMRKRPFGEIAANSKLVADAVDDYMNQVVQNTLQTEFEMLEKRFLQAGFKVS